MQQVVEILYDYIKDENDRNSKILDFHQPDEMKKLLDLSIPEKPMNLGELLKVINLLLFYAITIPIFSRVAKFFVTVLKLDILVFSIKFHAD